MINDLAEIRGVSGLSEDELAALNALIATWWRKRPRNMLRNRYYDSHNRLKDLGISIPPPLRNIATYISWPAKAVDYMADRVVLEGFTFKGADGHEELDAVMGECDFLSAYSQAVSDALVSSFSLVSVTKGFPGEPDVVVSAHSARDSAAIWDYRTNRIRCALVVADVRRGADGRVIGPSLVNVFTRGEVITLAWRRNGRWVIEDRQQHSQGHTLVEAIRHSPRLGRPLGRSRISRAVMSITDSAVREALRAEVSAEFFTAPQKFVLGAKDDLFDDRPKWEAYIGNYFAVGPNEYGQNPTVGQFPQVSMQPHIDYERQLAARFAGETSVPISSLGVIHDNPSSAEAIYAAKEDIIIKAQNFNRENAPSLSRLAKLVMAVAEGTTVDKLSDIERSVRPRFISPDKPSIASVTDAAIKVASAVPDYAGTRVFWEDMGREDAAIDRIQADIAKQRSQSAVQALMGAPGKPEAGSVRSLAAGDGSAGSPS